MNESAPVAFIDIETTSLHADEGEIWEVGLIAPGVDEQAWMLPVTLEHADPISLEIGGFHRRHPQGNDFSGEVNRPDTEMYDPARHDGAPVLRWPKSAARDLARMTHGCHLAGAVVSFDEERLRRFLWTHEAVPSWHYHLIDVETLAVGWLLGRYWRPSMSRRVASASDDHFDPRQLPWNSKQLSQAVGVDPARFRAHEALEDARWAKALYEAVMGPSEPATTDSGFAPWSGIRMSPW